MQEQVLSPSMQDADHADLGAQVFAIDGDLEQGLSTGGEQQVVEQTRVLQGQHIEFVRHSEHNMEVAGGQEVRVREPSASARAPASGTWGSADFCTSCMRWPGDRSSGRHRDDRPALRCGITEWRETLCAAESQSWIDSYPESDRPAGEGCRPPRRWAE